ncbi:hypothetical protein TrLO_g7690 [Triparma laevis f. longispina]|uniref:Phosphatidylinositol-3-phosphatase n=1 Tax=Triparma laevis f. longispina TaxID=1714387 RepID=A0A9W7DV57_9STRA|nr:hypothetical protein TrLO_g7690 [Triparma laevis f. longispina]
MSDAEDELFDRDKWGEQLYAGSIEKRGVSAIKNWKTRHVELYETRIVYFTKEGDTSPKGSFVISEHTEFGHSKLRPFCFYLKSRPANAAADAQLVKLHLRASSTESRDDWLAAIRMAVLARKELASIAPRESLLSADIKSQADRFSTASSVLSDINGYSTRSNDWRQQKDKELNNGPKLTIKVKGTIGVVNKAKGSSLLPDPYCVVSVGSTVVQTKTAKQNLNPQWDESFSFDFNHSLRYASVEVWDSSSHAKPTFMGHTMVPLFHMSAGAMHRKTYSLGKRSHKSHVSGKIVLEVYTDFCGHDKSMDFFRAIRSLPEFSTSLWKQRVVEEEGGKGVEESGSGGGYLWEERMDEVSGHPYYFNSSTLVTHWEKPEDFDLKGGAQSTARSRKPPTDPHPSLSQKPEEVDEAGASMTLTIAERAAAEKAKAEMKQRQEEEAEKNRRKSKLIKLGSSLRMTMTWGGSKSGSTLCMLPVVPDKDDPGSKVPPGEPLQIHEPFPSSMPPLETERLEDITWRVILHSPPDVTNSIRTMGVLIITNYRLMFVPEGMLLSSFDPDKNPRQDFNLTLQVPIMMVGQSSVVNGGRDLLIKTKDAHEFWFTFAESHRSEVEEELLQMESERQTDSRTTVGGSMAPKKLNQMNTGIKGLRLAVKGGSASSLFSSFTNKTGISSITHAISNKISKMTIGGGDSSALQSSFKVPGLQLQLNAKTSFENFLLGVQLVEGANANSGVGGAGADREAKSLYTKTPWSEEDLDICQGVLSDDGSALRRFSSRLKYRIVNAQFETMAAVEIHQQLCESLRIAAEELGEDGEDDDDIEVRVSAYDYVEERETGLTHDDTTFNVSMSWIKDAQRTIKEGWKVYDIEAEYKRLGVPDDKWRISKVNSEFGVCPTYPNVWAVPSTVTDKQLEKAAKHRSKGRLPVLTWRHPTTKATITRCSQPMVGLSMKRNGEDENLLTQINACSGGVAGKAERPFVIIDARPKVNAQVNQAAGKGFESSKAYINSELIFMNIGNIHTMRKSVEAIGDACCNRSHDGSSWLKALDDTQWLYHCHKVLRASVHVAHLVGRRGISCLVHCSDGWDRTAQISSLAQLIMDPYYRTIKGFQVLIEKDWLSFGFKFADRNGFHKNGGHHSHERSPVFIQFLDCVHQLLEQHPTKFEFNINFLREVCIHSHSAWYGNFLFNTMRERVGNKIAETTVSFWTWTSNNLEVIVNKNFEEKEASIMVDASPKKMNVWNDWFMKWHDLEYSALWASEGSHERGAKRGSAMVTREEVDGGERERKFSAVEGLTKEELEGGEEDDLPSEPETWEGMDEESEGEEERASLTLVPPPPVGGVGGDGGDGGESD